MLIIMQPCKVAIDTNNFFIIWVINTAKIFIKQSALALAGAD